MSMTEQPLAEAGVATLATKATNYGAATAVAGSFFLDNFVGIIGLAIAFLGFLINWYYKHQALKLQRKKHAVDVKVALAGMEANNPRPQPEPEH